MSNFTWGCGVYAQKTEKKSGVISLTGNSRSDKAQKRAKKISNGAAVGGRKGDFRANGAW